MQLKMMVPKTIDAAYLEIVADVRYWEDATVTGADSMPFRVGDSWCPRINIGTGKIDGWPEGVTANVHFKVCDCGEYWLQDSKGDRVAKFAGDYVPSWACPGGNGYGDYIIMDIQGDGTVSDWEVCSDDLDDGDLIPAKAA